MMQYRMVHDLLMIGKSTCYYLCCPINLWAMRDCQFKCDVRKERQEQPAGAFQRSERSSLNRVLARLYAMGLCDP